MKTMTLEEFTVAMKAQGVPLEHVALQCPVCGTVQSASDLIAAGAGDDFEAVEKYIGFSCVGRWTDAGPFSDGDPTGQGCDWTLGGLFGFHQLEVITPDGQKHPRFMLAEPTVARAHRDACLAAAD